MQLVGAAAGLELLGARGVIAPLASSELSGGQREGLKKKEKRKVASALTLISPTLLLGRLFAAIQAVCSQDYCARRRRDL